MKANEQLLADLFLPVEALDAFRAGEEWEYTPDTVDGADADVLYCSDCATWHMNWTVWGLRLDADGTLNETLFCVDSDGNWEFSEEFEYGTYDHDSDRKGIMQRWREYAEWVVHNKSDPLGEFSSGGGVEFIPRTWVAQFGDSILGPKVIRVRPLKGKYRPLADAPVEVRQYLADMNEFTSVEDLHTRAMYVDKWLGFNRAQFTVHVTKRIPAKFMQNALAFLSRNTDKE